MSAEALARVLCSADGLDPDARERGAGPLWENYQAQAARLLADPAPLLAALAKAGVLIPERGAPVRIGDEPWVRHVRYRSGVVAVEVQP